MKRHNIKSGNPEFRVTKLGCFIQNSLGDLEALTLRASVHHLSVEYNDTYPAGLTGSLRDY